MVGPLSTTYNFRIGVRAAFDWTEVEADSRRNGEKHGSGISRISVSSITLTGTFV